MASTPKTVLGPPGFLTAFLPAYPSYSDPHQSIARSLEASGLYPQTLFYDSRGGEVIDHGGSYTSVQTLERDIRRYAVR